MFNRTRLVLGLAALLAAALPASAQTMDHHQHSMSLTNSLISTPSGPATVEYYDADPQGSSRQISRTTLALPAGENHRAERRFLAAAAPHGAKFARVQLRGGEMQLINLHPTRKTYRH